MFYMIAFYNDSSSIEFFLVEWFIFRSRNQVIQRAQLSVAFHTQFCIRMLVIVKNLEFATDSRAFPFIQPRIHKIFNSAICTFSNLEVYFQNKVLVFTGSHNITTICRFSSTTLHYFQNTIFYLPAFCRESRKFSASPSVSSLTIP